MSKGGDFVLPPLPYSEKIQFFVSTHLSQGVRPLPIASASVAS